MIKDINIKLIVKILSIFLLVESFFMFLSALVSFTGLQASFFSSDIFHFLLSGVITFSVGLGALLLTMKEEKKVSIKESILIFFLLWVTLSLFGSLPFLLSGTLPAFTDAFFEAVSGFTTTGSTMLTNMEALSPGIIFWRSIMQWLGGIFFIIFSLSLLPQLGIGGYQFHESLSFHSNKLHPRMESSIIWLCIVYILLTVLETIALKLAGMSFFDAVCHSFSTISTGGFSTRTDNISFWDSAAVEYVLIVFMLLAGVNFTLFFFLIKGRFKRVFTNEEFRFYILFVLFLSFIAAGGLFAYKHMDMPSSIRTALFQVTSVISTTGFYTDNISSWPLILFAFMLILMFSGASYGSASGGVKISRIILILKNSFNEMKRFMHPNAISLVRYNKQLVPLPVINNAFLFLLLYMLVVAIGVLFFSFMELNFADSLKITLANIGNIGSSSANFTSLDSLASLSAAAKYFLMLLMTIGRVELFAFFLLFTRSFWTK